MSKQTKVCAQCGTLFERRQKASARQWNAQRFCSVACGAKVPHPRPIAIAHKVCAQCGVVFAKPRNWGFEMWASTHCCSRKCAGLFRRIPAAERFEALYTPEPNTGCFLWIGAVNMHGYGTFHDGDHLTLASRYSLSRFIALNEGDCVLHRCDNPPCVNPDHLFVGTKKDNTHDMLRKWRHPHGSSHHQAKLTEEAVSRIRASSAEGRYLAELYGVAESTISVARRGLRWTHVESSK